MKKEDIIKRINHLYLLKKMEKYPYTAPEMLSNELTSDQAKAIVEVFAELMEELTEKKRKVIKIDYEKEKDIDFARRFIELYEKINKDE